MPYSYDFINICIFFAVTKSLTINHKIFNGRLFHANFKIKILKSQYRFNENFKIRILCILYDI